MDNHGVVACKRRKEMIPQHGEAFDGEATENRKGRGRTLR
jgi:hypothetical protein